MSQIAKDEAISPPYLEQILQLLKKKKWIRSLRGPQGGYTLAKRPADIKVGPVLRDLEGRKSSFFIETKGKQKKNRRNTVALASLIFWGKLATQYTQLIDNTSLKELIDEARLLEKSKKTSHRTSFNI